MLARSAGAGRIIRQHETGGGGDNESGPRTGKRRAASADRSPDRRDAGGGGMYFRPRLAVTSSIRLPLQSGMYCGHLWKRSPV